MNTHTALKYSLLILLLVVLAYGYQFYSMNNSARYYSPSSQIHSSSTAPVSSLPMRTMLLQKVSSSTQADLKTHFAFVAQSAVPTNTIRIVSCAALPPVSSIKRNANITFMNIDNATHTIAFSPKQIFTLAPKTSKTMKATFGVGATGLYGFTCDKSTGFAGMILLLN